MGNFTFKKAERLTGKKNIQELFEKGSSFYLYPFKVLYLQNLDEKIRTHRVLISVSNKAFPRAVDRNLIKRRIRESYRLQKSVLKEKQGNLKIGLVYTAKEILPFQQTKAKVFLVLEKIQKLDYK
jgi:ribonuclease P protein component